MTHPDHTASPYALVALRQLEDTAVTGGFDETMEARFAADALGSEQIDPSLQRVKPGKRLEFAHRHRHDEEIYIVVAGSGRALVDRQVIELVPWSALRIAPGAGHTFEADADGLEFVVLRRHSTQDDSELVDLDWPG